MSRPTQDQIDFVVVGSRRLVEKLGAHLSEDSVDEVVVILADDLKSAREESGKLRRQNDLLHDSTAMLEAERGEVARLRQLLSEVTTLQREYDAMKAENDAMAALLVLYRKPCESPQARDTETDALLAARAKRMGER